MDVIEAIKTRKSIRGYKPDPVPKEVLKEILEAAASAPSSMNTQPWGFAVLAGEVLDKIKRVNIEKFDAGEPRKPEMGRMKEPYAGKHRERQVALGIQLFQLMGIGREDKEKRVEWLKRGTRFFDAPAAIVLLMDNDMSDAQQFNMGCLAQNISLAALNYGLGTAIQDMSNGYPEVLREFASIPESQRICICLSIGYPDWDFPANKVQSEREPIDSITTWNGF